MLIRLAALLALLTSGLVAAAEAPDDLRERTLSLGAFFGRERLHLIAWSEKAEVVRIKIPHVDDKRPETETYFGRAASGHIALSADQLKEIRKALLDPTTFLGGGLERPAEGRGAGVLCGFLPIVGVRFLDSRGVVDVLLCLGCQQVEVRDANENAALPVSAYAGKPKDRSFLSHEGTRRLTDVLAKVLAGDEGFEEAMKMWKAKYRAPAKSAGEPGVAADGAASRR
ncbi:MAG: hypothetical protein JWM82_3802 [Myxococcales bacterium]|nr:hypothetical protein [Myxococcales bacterium]